MSQRFIIAIGISGFVGVVLLVLLNVVNALGGPTATPRTGSGPTPSATSPSASASASPTRSAPPSRTPTPTRSATPEPTATPTGPTGTAQSAGTVTLTITDVLGVPAQADAVCQWAADEPLRVESIDTADAAPIEVGLEQVTVQLRPGDLRHAIMIRRLVTTTAPEHAPYGPTRARPGQIAVEPAGTDQASGTVTFKGIGTTAAATPPDLLPVKRAVYARPFGNQPSANLIAGTVTWQCEPAPAEHVPGPAQPTPTPAPSDDPGVARVPALGILSSSNQRATAFSGCIDRAVSQDGTNSISDQCLTAWLSPDDYPTTVVLRAAGRLVLTPESGWKIAKWAVRGSTVDDVESTLGKPKTDLDLFKGDRTSAPVGSIFFKAPSAGTWILRAKVSTVGPGKAAAETTYFFIIKTS